MFKNKNASPDFETSWEKEQPPVRMLMEEARTAKAREIGQKLGVTVTVIAKSGEQYTTTPDPTWGRDMDKPYTGPVPEGKAYVQIERNDGVRDLSDFWKAMDAK
jgi:hypothetical protein